MRATLALNELSVIFPLFSIIELVNRRINNPEKQPFLTISLIKQRVAQNERDRTSFQIL